MEEKKEGGPGKAAARRTKKSKREDIVLTKENMLYQPLALAVNGFEATAFQQNVVIAVLRKLRGAIKEMRDGQYRKKPVQLSIFDNEGVQKNFLRDGDLAFDIHLKELGVDTPHYSQAFKAVCTIADAKVWVPAQKEDGTQIMIRKSFFEIGSENITLVRNPKTGRQEYKYKSRSPIFTVIMSKEVVNVLFPNDGKIYDFIDNTAMIISEKFPKRIYLYLSNFKYMEGGMTVDYWKFRHDIGFNDSEVDPKTKERIIQYPHYCDFVKRVLRPSVETLKDMADNDISDFYFEYEPIYKTSKRQKNPDQLHFTFHLSNVGTRIKEDKATVRETIEIERRLSDEFDQSPAQVRRIITSITPDDREAFVEKMNELSLAIEQKKVQIKDSKRSYCNKTFTDFLQTRLSDKKKIAERIASAAQMGNGNSDGVSVAQEDAAEYGKEGRGNAAMSGGSSSQNPGASDSATTSAKSGVQCLYTQEEGKLYRKVVDELANNEDFEGISSWLAEIVLYKVEDDSVTVAVPTRAFHQSFQHYFGSALVDRLEEAYGKPVAVRFVEKF